MTGQARTKLELDAWLAFALACCDAADALALRHFRRDLIIETKPDRTFVTEADQAIERTIRELIAAAYPDHGLVGEEYGAAGRGNGPLVHRSDRRHPQLHARRAVVRHAAGGRGCDGELQVGVMSAPALGGRWFARRGGGSVGGRRDRARRPGGRGGSASRESGRLPTRISCTARPRR